MTSDDKTKLDGIAAGAQVNVGTNLGITAGTTAGPIVTSSTGNNATLPTATASASGVVTTGNQTWAGVKTFNSTITGSISGNAGTATTLQTARTIGGVSFNGSANINLPGVNEAGNQNTSGSSASCTGNSATATTLQTARTINGTSFNGSANITTANWGTARTLWGQSVNGSANITTPLRPDAGTVSAPAFSTSGDTNTGIFFPVADTIAFAEGGVEQMRITSAGNVGIGTTSPTEKLDVNGTVKATAFVGVLQQGTSVASTSGTAIDFTGLPTGVKRITVMFSGVSLSGTSSILVQLGDDGGVENTGYLSTSFTISDAPQVTAISSTAGGIIRMGAATVIVSGNYVINNISGNDWLASGLFLRDGNTNLMVEAAMKKSLSATLDRIRITTVNGTDTFDAGSINILWEF
jgi:hypothetical protein